MMQSVMCPRLGVEAAVAETTETRFPQGVRWLWWRCLACGGWHLCLGHEHRSSAEEPRLEERALAMA